MNLDLETYGAPAWTSHFRDAARVVHRTRDGYRSEPVATPQGVFPSMMVTDCGMWVLTMADGTRDGEYVGTQTPITCVRCAGGAKDGKDQRYSLKALTFGVMYGASPGQLRARYGMADTVVEHALYGPYGKSVYRRCRRLAFVLYAKAAAA